MKGLQFAYNLRFHEDEQEQGRQGCSLSTEKMLCFSYALNVRQISKSKSYTDFLLKNLGRSLQFSFGVVMILTKLFINLNEKLLIRTIFILYIQSY